MKKMSKLFGCNSSWELNFEVSVSNFDFFSIICNFMMFSYLIFGLLFPFKYDIRIQCSDFEVQSLIGSIENYEINLH